MPYQVNPGKQVHKAPPPGPRHTPAPVPPGTVGIPPSTGGKTGGGSTTGGGGTSGGGTSGGSSSGAGGTSASGSGTVGPSGIGSFLQRFSIPGLADLPKPVLPTFKEAADSIRNWWFGLLGTTQGFPYNAQVEQGVTIVLQFLGSGGQALPAGMDAGVTIKDPSGVALTYAYSNLQPLAADGSVTLDLPITVWASREYSVEIDAYFPPTPYSAVGMTATFEQSATGDAMHTGITFTNTLAPFASSGKFTLKVVDGSGQPVVDVQANVSVIDASLAPGTGAGGATIAGSGKTDSNGELVVEGAVDYLTSDVFNVNWSAGASYGTTQITGEQLSSGAIYQVTVYPAGGAPAGTAGSVEITVMNEGSPVDGASVSASITESGSTDMIWGGSGETNANGVLVLVVDPTAIKGLDTVQFGASAQKPLGSGKGPQPRITGTAVATLNVQDIDSGKASITIQCTVEK